MPDGDIDGMIPFADMFNHKSDKFEVSYRYNKDKGGFVMKANYDIKAGEPLHIRYCCKNNI